MSGDCGRSLAGDSGAGKTEVVLLAAGLTEAVLLAAGQTEAVLLAAGLAL